MTVETGLPTVAIDLVTEEISSGIQLINRNPDSGETSVPTATPIYVRVLNADPGGTIVQADIRVYLYETSNTLVYDGASFQTGFTGSVTPWGTNGFDISFARTGDYLTVSVGVRIDVGIQSQSYGFTFADEIPPRVASAVSRDARTVRVTFNENVTQLSASGAYDALNPANYSISAQSAPAYAPTAASVATITSKIVDVTFASELTFGASYLLTVANVRDTSANVVVAPYNTAYFVCVVPVVAGRRFSLYDMQSEADKASDRAGTLDLWKFLQCLQEVVDVILHEQDAFLDILDPDLAPEQYLDAMLADLGNPFAFELSTNEKRKLLRVLVQIYGQLGTAQGIINAVQFFLGETVTISLYTTDTMVLGEAELGYDSYLGPTGSWLKYAFQVVHAGALTSTQRSAISDIVNYMKPANTHFVGIVEV